MCMWREKSESGAAGGKQGELPPACISYKHHMWWGMGKGTYRVTKSNLKFFTFLVLWGMISAWTIVLATVFIETLYILWIFAAYLSTFFLKQYLSPFFPRLLNIYKTLNAFFSKQYLCAIGPFSHASSHIKMLALKSATQTKVGDFLHFCI